jgi:hypothetical protein
MNISSPEIPRYSRWLFITHIPHCSKQLVVIIYPGRDRPPVQYFKQKLYIFKLVKLKIVYKRIVI